MQFLKLAFTLTAFFLFLGCAPQSPPVQPEATPSETPQPIAYPILKNAIEDLQNLNRAVETGMTVKAYSDWMAETRVSVQHATGEPKALAAVKSAAQAHQYALELWQCDKVENYTTLKQCREKELSEIFTKYPDIKANILSAFEGKALSTISVQLDQEALLKMLWIKAKADTEEAAQVFSTELTPKEGEK